MRQEAGPDEVSRRSLRACTDRLIEVFTKLATTVCSPLTIITVTTNNKCYCLNEYNHTALTPIITKCFESLVHVRLSKYTLSTLILKIVTCWGCTLVLSSTPYSQMTVLLYSLPTSQICQCHHHSRPDIKQLHGSLQRRGSVLNKWLSSK